MSNSENNAAHQPAQEATPTRVPFEVVDSSQTTDSTESVAVEVATIPAIEVSEESSQSLEVIADEPSNQVEYYDESEIEGEEIFDSLEELEKAHGKVKKAKHHTVISQTQIVEEAVEEQGQPVSESKPQHQASDTANDLELNDVATPAAGADTAAESVVQAANQTVAQSVNESVSETIVEPVAEAPDAEAETVAETVAEPVAKSSKQPIVANEEVEDSVGDEVDEAFAEEEATLAFAEMGLAPEVLAAIKTAGYTTPSPIQEETVPYLMEGHDMIGQAETGSGKTAAFAWPILSRLDLNTTKPQVLILAPTRELAIQVTTNFQKYAAKIPDFRATTIYGGQNYETQFRALKRGAHVVVGTPGRVIDHLSRGTLDLSDLKVFVLDEADEMLRMGFIDDIERVLEATPRTQQTVFFSATMPPQIRRIADNYLRDPVHIEIESNSATADSIKQSFIMVEPRQKMQRLARFMETEETDGVLIFVKTRNTTNVVAENLIQKGIVASSLNGDIPQNQRERTVSQLKSGKIDVVVATDVAARGLDVSRISHVINYDFPHDTEAYVHRIGRTGRAGREGNAVLFVEPKEKGKLHRLQRATNQKIDAFQQKSLKEINDIRVNKFKQRIIDAADEKSFGFFAELITSFAEESELPMETIAAGLAVMAQGDAPLLLEALKTPKSNWKKDRDNKGKRNDGPMQTFRVEVGRNDGVGPGNLVGAITNEANLTNADIGRIQLFDTFSTVDLPADLPADLVSHLGEVYVNGRPLQITRSDEKYDDRRGGGRGGRDSRGGGGRGRRDNASGRHQGGGRGRREGGFRDSGPRGRGRDNASGAGRRDRNERGGSYSESRGRRDDRGPRGERPSRDDRGGRGGRPSRDDRGGRAERPSRDDRPRFGGRSDRNERGRDDRPARRSEGGGGRPRSDREGDFRGRRDSERGGDRRESRSGDDKPKRKKTKAALRTQQKRKPDAKMTTPFKKYVKIRSAKKK